MLHKILTVVVIVVFISIMFTVATFMNKSNDIFDNNIVPKLTLQEANQIAQNSECVKEGKILETNLYNPNSKTYWFNLDVNKSGCNPACVVYEDKRTEINYRCTGLISDDIAK